MSRMAACFCGAGVSICVCELIRECAYFVIQLCPQVCNSMFVSAYGLICLPGVFITLSDLQHDSYFMSHIAQL